MPNHQILRKHRCIHMQQLAFIVAASRLESRLYSPQSGGAGRAAPMIYIYIYIYTYARNLARGRPGQ